MDQQFSETTGSVARAAGCLPELVRRYADEGLIEFRRLADGTRTFKSDAPEKVRQLKVKRLARGGRTA